MPTYTIGDFVASSGAKASTLAAYERQLGYVERMIGKPLADASLNDLARLGKRLRKMRSGPHLANLTRMFYRAAGRETDDDRYRKYVDRMPLKQRMKRLAPGDVLTLPEVNQLIRAASNLRDRALIVALWETGARIHELLAVDLRDVHEIPSKENGRTFYRIHFRKVKVEGEEHSSYITDGPDHLRAWLDAHPRREPNAPLFPSWDARMSRKRGWEIVKSCARRAGLGKRVYPHLFRHSRATHLLRSDMSEPMVKKLLGWSPGSPMLNRYSHLIDRDAYAALLRAQGLEAPEPVDFGRLVDAEGDLRPVAPMQAPPGRKAHDGDAKALLRTLLDYVAQNPDALAELKAELGK